MYEVFKLIMKKTKLPVLLLSLIMTGTSLASCRDTESTKDEKIDSIAIVEDSIAKTYTIGSKVDYSKLAIQTFNASKEVVSTLKVSENKDKITYTTIDTSTLTEKRTFEVELKIDSTVYKTSMDYKVIDIQYELNDWTANENYTRTVTTTGNSKLTDPNSSTYENGFIKAGTYYVGNENAVSLMPTITGLNPDNPMDIVKLEKIPADTTFSLKNEKGEKVELENKLEFIDELKTKGTVKFKKDVTGKFTLTLANPSLSNEISYEINVVSAYNVNKAIDMFALSNSLNCGNYGDKFNEKMKTFKEENGLPETTNGLVFQNDITFNRSDVPSFLLWQKGEANDASVAGSLKDWIGLIDHRFTKDNEKVTIYGNCHRLMINDDENDKNAFPYILTDSFKGDKQEANKPISSHATFFYSDYATGVNPETCTLTFKDFEMSGNMGVSDESNITKGGPMLAKGSVNMNFDNVIASKVYMPVMIEGHYAKADGGWYSSTLNIDDCRFRDLFNAGVYVYGNGKVNINHSEMMKSGGPLLFLNATTEELPAYPTDLSKLASTIVNIDESSVLSNYTEGKGGWFDAYNGASAIAGQIANLDALFNQQCKTSYMKKDKNGVNKFDFWMVMLPINDESIELPVNKGGSNVEVNVGGKNVYSTLGGRDLVFQKALAMSQSPSQENIMGYVNALTSTDFGNNLAYSAIANEVTFKVVDDEKNAHYAALNSIGGNSFYLCDSKYLLLSHLGQDVSSLSSAPHETFSKASKALALTVNGAAQSVNPQDPSTMKGVCNYGLLLGNYYKLS